MNAFLIVCISFSVSALTSIIFTVMKFKEKSKGYEWAQEKQALAIKTAINCITELQEQINIIDKTNQEVTKIIKENIESET